MKGYFDIPDTKQTILVEYDDSTTDLSVANLNTKIHFEKMLGCKVRLVSKEEYNKLTKQYLED